MEKRILGRGRIYSDYEVGRSAALVMYALLLCLILQVVVWIVVAVFVFLLLPEGIIPVGWESPAVVLLLCLGELTVIGGVIRHVVRKSKRFELVKIDSAGVPRFMTIREQNLETLFRVTAVGGILWVLLLGMNSYAVQVFLTVLDGFGVLFFTVFLVVRFYMTGAFRWQTLLTILLNVCACGSAWR